MAQIVKMGELQTQRLVSIIIPTHNRAHYLKEMLFSLATQSYRPVEVVVVDDASTDETPRMMVAEIENLHAAGIDCHYTTQAKSNGSCARNRGFQLSHGAYIIFMDSDDYAHPEMISRMMHALEQSNADFCVCDSARFRRSPGDSSETKKLSGRQHTARAHLRSIALQTCFLARRSVIDAIGPWEEELTHRQDVEYTFRILASGFRGAWIPEVLYFWREHDNQVSKRTDEEALSSSLLVLNKMVAFAKLKGQYTWFMRFAFGREFSRIAYACNRLGYAALARQAGQYARQECVVIQLPFYFYGLVRRIMGEKLAYKIKRLFH